MDGCSVVHSWALAGAVVELIGHVISITTVHGKATTLGQTVVTVGVRIYCLQLVTEYSLFSFRRAAMRSIEKELFNPYVCTSHHVKVIAQFTGISELH